MNRRLNIFITTLLVATYAMLVPAHIAKDQVHALLHGNPVDVAEQSAHETLTAYCCDSPAACVDTSGSDSPNRHCAHAHSSAEQGLSRSRGDAPHPNVVALAPSASERLHQVVCQPVEFVTLLPLPATSVAVIAPRGPPVC